MIPQPRSCHDRGVAAEDLLAGPRGRRLCWELLRLCAPDLLIRRARTSSVSEEAVRRWHDKADDAATGDLLFEGLRASVDAARYWQDPDDDDREIAADELTALLAPVAEFIHTSSHGNWWATALDRTAQARVCFLRDGRQNPTPEMNSAVGLREWHADTDRSNEQMRRQRFEGGEALWAMTSGTWWTPPISSRVVSTTRIRESLGPVGLWLDEDFGGEHRARSWRVHPADDLRVFEIDGPVAWADLVARYPLNVTYARGANWQQATGRDGAWLLPDWTAMSDDYDAVHLTVSGYLTTSGRTVFIDSQHASLIAGWAPDECFWLTDALSMGAATDWIDGGQDGRWTRERA